MRASASGPSERLARAEVQPRSSPARLGRDRAELPDERDPVGAGGRRLLRAGCVDASIASIPTRTTFAAELVSASTERIWRPTTGSTMNGFSRNESPALAAWSNSALGGLHPVEALSADQLRRAEVVLHRLELVEPLLRVPAGLHQLERGHRAPDDDDHDDREPDQPAPGAPSGRARSGRGSGGLGGSGASDMGRSILRAGACKFGHTSYIATPRHDRDRRVVTAGRYGRCDVTEDQPAKVTLGAPGAGRADLSPPAQGSTRNTRANWSANGRWRVSNQVTEEIRLAHTELAAPRPTGSTAASGDLTPEQRRVYELATRWYVTLFTRPVRVVDEDPWGTDLPGDLRLVGPAGLGFTDADDEPEIRLLAFDARPDPPPALVDTPGGPLRVAAPPRLAAADGRSASRSRISCAAPTTRTTSTPPPRCRRSTDVARPDRLEVIRDAGR